MSLFDTHCHIHEAIRRTTPVYDKWHAKGASDVEQVLNAARTADVRYITCVGTTLADSELAVEFVQDRPDMWASIGIHPHEASDHLAHGRVLPAFAALAHETTSRKIVAIGECGLDYFYEYSSRADQLKVLEFQLELALAADLPLIFHVREAFDDFWALFERFRGLRGVLHSYTDSQANLERALGHGLFIGVNGIMTFTKDPQQLAMYKAIPLQKLLLETDAPFLTPAPYRGTMCEPRHVAVTAEFAANLRGETLEQITAATTTNAFELFGINQ